MRALSVTSEFFPLIKTGGLADVAGALPLALAGLGCEMRTLLPGYPSVLDKVRNTRSVASLPDLMGGPAELLATEVSGAEVLLIEAPHLYARPGGPYLDPAGLDWADNHLRFAALCWVAREIGLGRLGAWRPDVVHAHDWQAGLAPAYLELSGEPRPGTVMTVHNLAFQGWFLATNLAALRLPAAAFSLAGVEYFNGIGFLKAGLFYADRLTTVSPTYAREIQTPAGGAALDGLLRARAPDLTGILNGIDEQVWDPQTDALLPQTFGPKSLDGKAACKAALQARLGLDPDPATPLFCVVSRLTWQKGMDLLLTLLPELMARGVQLGMLGSGDPALEGAFLQATADHPGRVGCIMGYDESLSHLLQGGSDAILVPSRFEPCGLTQLIGLRYGTLPIVARVGGLADTVVDANEAALTDGVATGFQFAPVTAEAFLEAVDRVLRLYGDRKVWNGLVRRAMTRDVGWKRSARHYLELYRTVARTPAEGAPS